MPAVVVQSGVNGAHTNLRTEAVGNLVYQFRTADGGAVDAHLVGAGIEQTLHVGQLVDASAHGEWDVDFGSHAGDHLRECLTSFEAGCDVQEAQFVGPLLRVGFAQLYRVARTPQVHEVRAFDGLTVLDVQTGYDSFC